MSDLHSWKPVRNGGDDDEDDDGEGDDDEGEDE
jgi:hypothetical protein